VTVLFCDVVGSTELGERLDPESVRRVLARFFETVREVVERHGGSVEKFIGDAVMAVFGVPVVHEDDALRAVRAAAELREHLDRLNGDLARDFGTEIEHRIGINTGEVVAGTEERLATGDAVNVAARLEQAAGPGQVLLGEATVEQLGEAVVAKPLPDLDLKGKSEPVRAWELRKVKAFETRQLSTVPMIGRERELEALRSAFAEAVEQQSCRLVTVVGAAGVGKSRLVAEFVAGLDGAGARVVRGRCLAYGEGITYRPVAEVVRALQDELEELTSEPRVLAALRGLIADDEASSTEEIAWAVRKLLEAAGAERPLVCVFDDVNWGENTFLDLVEQIAALARGAPLLLICMARPDLLDRRPGWGGVVRLDPLSDEESNQLIAELGGDRLEEQLRERIQEAAEGNPLFVEEMIAMLDEAQDAAVAVPRTIAALLASRLDQLPPAERTVLECGAVEGRVFHLGAVQALAPTEAQLGGVLASLVRKDLLRPDLPQAPNDEVYRFRHLLIRDAAYDTLPKSARADLHERLADWLEARSEDVLDGDEVLGYHLEQAYRYRQELAPGVPGSEPIAARAADLLEAAGRRALARLDAGAARNLFERALALRPQVDPALTLRLDLTHALFLSGEFTAASNLAQETASIAAARGNRAGELRARLAAARLAVQMPPQYDGAREPSEALLALAEEARPVFTEAGDEVGLTDAWVATAWAQLIRSRWGAMLDAVEQAISHAQRAGHTHWERELPVWKGTALFYGPTPVEEILRWQEAEQPQHSMALNHRAVLEAMCGRFDSARALLATADNAAVERGELLFRAGGAMSEWEVETLAGYPAAAERAARRTCDWLEELGETGFRSLAIGQLAWSLVALGQLDDAERLTQQAEVLASPDDVLSQMLWRQVRARLHARGGRPGQGEQLAREAVLLGEETEMLNWHAHALVDLGDICMLAGKKDEGGRHLAHALALYERKGNVVSAAHLRAALGSHAPPGLVPGSTTF
jgi:class 3 adenylate cyclase/tetratricopeptide (TPR) repeat protein